MRERLPRLILRERESETDRVTNRVIIALVRQTVRYRLREFKRDFILNRITEPSIVRRRQAGRQIERQM